MTDKLSSKFNILISEDFLSQPAMLSINFAILAVIICISFYIITSFFSLSAANQVHKIRCLFMASILKQDIGWFDIRETGDFASRLTSDLNKIEDGIGEKVGFCISFFSSVIFCMACALFYGWKLTLVMLSITPIMALAVALLSRAQAALSYEESKAYGTAGAIVEEALSSIRTVVAFGGELKEIQRYEKHLTPARRKGIKRGFLTSLGIGLSWFSVYFGYAVAFWYGVRLIIEDKDKINPTYTAGTLLVVFSNVLSASMFVGQIAPFFEVFALAKGAAGIIFSVIDRKPEIDSSSLLGLRPSSLNGKITLTNVHFNYPARFDVKVLKGISLVVNPGETVALVGPSGCGKSTIIQLILRFYDTTEGSIRIDNNNVKNLNIGWLRSNIGFVGQEPVLFSTTIGENIRFGKDDATSEEIKRAAKLANIHEFISNLPKKYNTLVGDRGTQLSGGQKQRIALARAIVKNPKILLLDEATSALDTENEAIVQLALDEARKGRTTIVVAHRLSTIRNADRIFVLFDGIIKEMGNHNELMENKGLYHHLVLSQMYEMENFLDDNVDGGRPVFSRRISALTSSSFTSRGSSQDTSGYLFKELDDAKPSVSWMRLLKISLSEWPYLIVGSVAALIMGLHTPLYGVIFGSILGVLSEDINKLSDHNAFYCIIFAIMSVTSFAMSFLQTFMFSVASEKLTSRLRKETFSKIITQDITWFDHPTNSVGSLCARLTSDASDMQGASGYRISTLVQTVSTITACTFLACYFNYKLGLLVFAFVPLILMAAYFGKRLTVGDILSDKSSLEVASKVAVEAIENIRTVASLNQVEGFYTRYTDALVLPYRNARKKSHVKGFTYAFSQSIQVFAYAATFYYGSVLIAQGELTYSDMYKAIEGVIVSIIVLGHLFAFAPDFQKAIIAAANIFEILDMKAGIDVLSSDGLSLKNINGTISLQNVYFNYPTRPKVKVLRDLSLDIESGKTVALVGSSGCGKSTCIQLIERFYDTDGGSVLLDGIHVEKINVRNLRSHIGLVSQEPVLFSCSIAENIAYGNNFEPVNMNEVITASRKANIHTFIASLPQGYATTVGTKGTQLSGGQKQRIAIARALLRDPKILLLDEATSALDAESEHIVQEALDTARNGRTCVIIAHRLTTIQTADSIAVIHKGRIVEHGTHQALLKMKGYYYRLYNNQYAKKSSTDA